MSEANFTTLNGLPAVEDRIVGGEDPDFPGSLAEPLVFAGPEFAAGKAGPEFAVGGAVALAWCHEHLVMLARDLGERVAHRGEEIVVGGDDGAVEIELDHGLRAGDRRDLAGVLHAADLALGDVGGELDDLGRLVGAVQDRIVRGLDPHFAAALGDALVFGGLIFAAIEPGPERVIVRIVALLRRHEHAVVLACDFVEPVTHRVEEILVGGDDRAVHVELDHRLRLADRNRLRQRVARGGTALPQRHKIIPFIGGRAWLDLPKMHRPGPH
jgi:hypothetical protein